MKHDTYNDQCILTILPTTNIACTRHKWPTGREASEGGQEVIVHEGFMLWGRLPTNWRGGRRGN